MTTPTPRATTARGKNNPAVVVSFFMRAALAVRAGLAFRSSPTEGSVSPGRTARMGICRAGIPPAGNSHGFGGTTLCCPQYKPGVHGRDGTRPSDSASRDWPMNIFSLQNRFRSGPELAGPLFHKANALAWCVLIVFSNATMVDVSREIRRARAEDLIDI